MYSIIAAISVIIRAFYLPNPFEAFGDIEIPFQETVIAISPIIINYLFEPILHAITYVVVGLYYKKHRNSASFGSLLYLVFYCVHVGLLYLMAQLGFAAWAVALINAGYVFCHIGINTVRQKLAWVR